MRRLLMLLPMLVLTACTTRVEYGTETYAPPADALNINTASIAELEKLPHIGAKTADAIVAFREKNGPFRRVEHLLLIPGISGSRLAEIRSRLRVDEGAKQ
jgi:competence ComEA-like helix-hairpin-helix protein